MFKYSLVIPCYNEAANLGPLIERCQGLLAQGVEVVLVDNGSTDDTASIMRGFSNVTVVRVPENKGYGFGILEGLRAAKGEILGWTHADLQTDPMDMTKAFSFFEENADIFVKGARFGRPLSDRLFTVGMSVFETLLLRERLWDINAQPTLFTKAFFDEWQSEAPSDFALDLFVFYRARAKKLPIHRIQVLFAPRLHGTSHWNINWAAKKKFIRRTVNFSLELRRKIK